jgi:hypothetical protein
MLMGAGVMAMGAGIAKTILFAQFADGADYFYKMSNAGIWLYVFFEHTRRSGGLTLSFKSRGGHRRRDGGVRAVPQVAVRAAAEAHRDPAHVAEGNDQLSRPGDEVLQCPDDGQEQRVRQAVQQGRGGCSLGRRGSEVRRLRVGRHLPCEAEGREECNIQGRIRRVGNNIIGYELESRFLWFL